MVALQLCATWPSVKEADWLLRDDGLVGTPS